MAVNIKQFLLSSFFILIVIVLAVILYPPAEKFVLDENKNLKIETNYLSYVLIFIASLIVNLYLSSSKDKEKYKLLSAETILSKPICQQQLFKHGLTQPLTFTHRQYIGEFSLGHLGIVATKNNRNELVYILYILDDNYDIRETKPQLESPILAISEHIYDVKDAVNKLTPTEKGTFETRLRQFLRDIKKQEKEYYENILEKAKENVEKEIEGE